MAYLADFGPLVHTVSVDRAVIAMLQKWMPTYLSAAEQREGKPNSWLARPVFYATLYDEDDEDHLSDRRMPTVYVTTSGATQWRRDGNNFYSALWPLRISYVSRGRTAVEARQQASLNIATVTDLLLSKPSLGGFTNGIDIVAERVAPVLDPSNRQRHLCAGMGEYMVMVCNIRRATSGPLDPDEPPPDPNEPFGPMPSVSDVEITVDGFSPTIGLPED